MVSLVLALVLSAALHGAAEGGLVETIAGTGRSELGLFSGNALEVNIGEPFGVEVGPDGALYVCEVRNHRVLRLDLEKGRIETVAGNGRKGYAGDGGQATEASLGEPYEVCFAPASMYFVEMVNAVVRRVDLATRTISTVAGTGKAGFGGDGGPGVKAELRQPHSIALDGKGGLYIADIGNHRVRRLDLASGLIETIAGDGTARMPEEGGVGTGKPILGPRALLARGDELVIALREGHSVWSLGLETRRLHRIAGTGAPGHRDGAAREAELNGPKGIAAGARGVLFVADTENQVIRAIRRAQEGSTVVETVAGAGPAARGHGGDGGPPLKAQFDRPHGIAASLRGDVLYVGDTNNHRVRRVKL